jgi:O-antigen/teichoic acid export membrane protein
MIRFSRLASVAAFSRNAFLTQLSGTLTYQADKLILAALLGPSAVTYYAVATSIGAQLVGASAAVSAFVFPRIAMLHAGRQQEQIRALYLAAFRYLLLAIGPLFISAILLVPDLFILWLGPEARQEAAVPAQLLLLAYFITVFSIIPCQVYNGMGETRLSLGYALLGTLTNIALCFVLIPRLGLAGAGIAGIAGMLPSIFLMVSVEKLLKLHWLREQAPLYLRLGLVLALQATLVAALRANVQGWLSLALVAGAGTLLSLGLWFATPLASDQDRTLARRLLQAMRVPSRS